MTKQNSTLQSLFHEWLEAIGGTRGTEAGQYSLYVDGQYVYFGQFVSSDGVNGFREISFQDSEELMRLWLQAGIASLHERRLPQHEGNLDAQTLRALADKLDPPEHVHYEVGTRDCRACQIIEVV